MIPFIEQKLHPYHRFSEICLSLDIDNIGCQEEHPGYSTTTFIIFPCIIWVVTLIAHFLCLFGYSSNQMMVCFTSLILTSLLLSFSLPLHLSPIHSFIHPFSLLVPPFHHSEPLKPRMPSP